MTLEAALCIPVMVLALYLLLYPLGVMEAERRLQNDMEKTAKYLILADYAEDAGKDILSLDSDTEELVSDLISAGSGVWSLAAVMADAASSGYFKNFLPDPDISILSDDEGDDPSMIYIRFNYDISLPFSLFDITVASKSLVTNRRAWTGSAGGRGRSKYASDDDSGEDASEDTVVYVGKTSTTVYHLSPDCHYLSNTTLTADASEMSSKRNSSGGTYHACPVCSPGTSGTVYYFTSGTAYHSSADCSAITSYVRCISLSEAAGMHVCSYCQAHYS